MICPSLSVATRLDTDPCLCGPGPGKGSEIRAEVTQAAASHLWVSGPASGQPDPALGTRGTRGARAARDQVLYCAGVCVSAPGHRV